MYYDLFDEEVKKLTIKRNITAFLVFRGVLCAVSIVSFFVPNMVFFGIILILSCFIDIAIFLFYSPIKAFERRIRIDDGKILIYSSTDYISSFSLESCSVFYKTVILQHGRGEQVVKKCLILSHNVTIPEKEPIDFSYYRVEPNVLFVQNTDTISLLESML